MDSLKTPVTIPNEFAEQATVDNINDIPQVATGSNLASWNEGFPEVTRLTPDEGGLPPKQQDFNGIYNAISSHSVFSQNGGSYTFNQDVSDKIGGYPLNAILWYFPSVGVPYQVRSNKANNNDNFIGNPSFIGTSWVRVVPVEVDSALSATSINPVQNKVVTNALNTKATTTYVNDTFANKSLSNLNAAGQAKFNAKQNTLVSGINIKTLNGESILGSGNKEVASVDLSNTGQLTNCVLSTGVNIQLEYTNTTLTLKAGSKVIQINGSYRVNTVNSSININPYPDGTYLLFQDGDESLSMLSTSVLSSGSVDPTSSTTGSGYYNYSTKVIWVKLTDWVPTGWSIPFTQITISGGKITDVEKLDTASYFGKTGFRLPLTALLANGLNEDGTYKTTKVNLTELSQRDVMNTSSTTVDVCTSTTGGIGLGIGLFFDDSLGYIIQGSDKSTYKNNVVIARTQGNSSVITSMNPVHPIRLADANVIEKELQTKANIDLSNTLPSQAFKDMSIGWGMPDYSAGVDITSQVFGEEKKYTASEDGILFMNIHDDGVAGIVKAKINNTLPIVLGVGATPVVASSISLPLTSGDFITCQYFSPSGYYKAYFIPLKGVN